MTKQEHATLLISELHPSFINLARRIQQVSRLAGKGIAVVSVTVFVDSDEAIQWTRPSVEKLTLLEPKGGNDEFCDKLRTMRR